MKITYYVATSLDGFIAREDGDVSWLDDMGIDMEETGYDEFFAGVDGLVMGRNTYDFIYNHGQWPYGDKPTWVFTKHELDIMSGANIRIVDKLPNFIEQAEDINLKHIWLVGGGKLASSFLDEGLITNLSISQMPLELRSGIPVFEKHSLADLNMKKVDVITLKGFKQIEIELLNK